MKDHKRNIQKGPQIEHRNEEMGKGWRREERSHGGLVWGYAPPVNGFEGNRLPLIGISLLLGGAAPPWASKLNGHPGRLSPPRRKLIPNKGSRPSAPFLKKPKEWEKFEGLHSPGCFPTPRKSSRSSVFLS